jgi:hypothetical protein
MLIAGFVARMGQTRHACIVVVGRDVGINLRIILKCIVRGIGCEVVDRIQLT